MSLAYFETEFKAGRFSDILSGGIMTMQTDFPVTLTNTAAEKAAGLIAREGRDDLRLRLAVQAGGCSGLIYQLYFDERLIDGDITHEFEGVPGEIIEVVIDKHSAPYLTGATVAFEDTIAKQGFQIDNPNASGSCACGDSFH